MRECRLRGTTRAVFSALVLIADWDGRSHHPYREIARIAGVSPMSCIRAMRILIARYYVTVLEHGAGRRPSYLKVAKWEPERKPVLVSPDDTNTESVVVSFEKASSL